MVEKVDVLRLMENVIFLKKYTLFSELNTEEIRALALIAHEIEVQDGECVVREGDPGDVFFIVKKGKMRIVKGTGSSAVVLSVMERPQCIGEMALFEEGQGRSANVTAAGPAILLKFHKDDLLDAMRKNPGISFEFLKIFGRRVRESNERLYAMSREKTT